jgi:hypothetical protein
MKADEQISSDSGDPWGTIDVRESASENREREGGVLTVTLWNLRRCARIALSIDPELETVEGSNTAHRLLTRRMGIVRYVGSSLHGKTRVPAAMHSWLYDNELKHAHPKADTDPDLLLGADVERHRRSQRVVIGVEMMYAEFGDGSCDGLWPWAEATARLKIVNRIVSREKKRINDARLEKARAIELINAEKRPRASVTMVDRHGKIGLKGMLGRGGMLWRRGPGGDGDGAAIDGDNNMENASRQKTAARSPRKHLAKSYENEALTMRQQEKKRMWLRREDKRKEKRERARARKEKVVEGKKKKRAQKKERQRQKKARRKEERTALSFLNRTHSHAVTAARGAAVAAALAGE